MIRIAAISFRPEIADMLQRFVGGILKDMAIVEQCYSVPDALKGNYDLYVVYTIGIVYKELNQQVSFERIIPVSLFPMASAIKRVMEIPEGSHLGVIGGHYWDATDLLGQLLETGIRRYRFTTGTIEDMNTMSVDYYLVPEELRRYVKCPKAKESSVIIHRGLDVKCISNILATVLNYKKHLK